MKKTIKDKYKDETDYNVKEGFEMMPSDGEGLSDNDIKRIKSPNYSRESFNLQENSKESLPKDNLERRLREQTKKINDLFDYKTLCENRIRQLMPSHPIPVKENHLKIMPHKFEESIKVSLDLENHNLKKDLTNYKNLINSKELEIQQLKKKLEYNAYKNSSSSEGFYKSNSNKDCKTNNIVSNFPTPERLANDKMKETYKKIFVSHNKLIEEREQILESLRKETLNNEEQRNYIEILKQTIEAKINKLGLSSSLNSQRSNGFYHGKDVSNIDVLVDVAQIQVECEKYRKDVMMTQVINQELRNEIEFLKKSNEDMKVKKEKIRDSLNGGIQELEFARERLNELESEKNEMMDQYSLIKGANEKLLKENDWILIKNKKLENEANELIKKLNEANLKLNETSFIHSKLNEYKKNYEKLNAEFERLNMEKTRVDEELNNKNEAIQNKLEEIKKLKNNYQSTCDKLELDKKTISSDSSTIANKMKKIEKHNTELQNTIKNNNIDIINLEEKISSLDLYIIDLKNTNENLTNDIDRIKKQFESQIDGLEKNIRENNSSFKDLKHQFENLQNEKKFIKDDFNKLKNENHKLENENKKLSETLEITKKNMEKLNDQYDEILYNYRQTESERNDLKIEKDEFIKEIKCIKEKNDKELNMKNTEIKQCNIEINNLKIEFKGCKEKLNQNKEVVNKDKLEIEELKKIIEGKDKKIENLLEKEMVNQKKIDELNMISNNFDNLIVKYDQLIKENGELLKKNEKLQLEKTYIMENLTQKEKSLFDTQEKHSNLLSNYNSLNVNYNDLLKKSEKSHQDSLLLGEKSLFLSVENKNTKKSIDNMSSTIESLTLHKENLESRIQKVLDENDYYKKIENNLQNELSNISREFEKVKDTLISSISNIKSLLTVKFHLYLTEPNSKTTQNFCDLIQNLQRLKLKESADPMECINLFEEVITELSCELENFKHLYDELYMIQSSSNNKLQTLDKNLFELDRKKNDSEIMLKKQLSQFAEDNRLLIVENDNYKKKLEDSKREFTALETDRKRLNNDFNIIKDKELMSKKEQEVLLRSYKIQIVALEERLSIVINEKKSIESLLNTVVNYFPNREMSKVVYNQLNSLEVTFEKQREKLKLDQMITQLSNQDNPNETMRSDLENHKRELKNVIQVINENMKLQNQNQLDMKNIESIEKRKTETILDNEQLLKKLEYDNAILNDELRRYKTQTGSSYLNVNKSNDTKNFFPSTSVNFNYDHRAKLDEFRNTKQQISPLKKMENPLNASITYNYMQGSNAFNNNLIESSQISIAEIKKSTDESLIENKKQFNLSLRKKDVDAKMNQNSISRANRSYRPFSQSKLLNSKIDNDNDV